MNRYVRGMNQNSNYSYGNYGNATANVSVPSNYPSNPLYGANSYGNYPNAGGYGNSSQPSYYGNSLNNRAYQGNPNIVNTNESMHTNSNNFGNNNPHSGSNQPYNNYYGYRNNN